MEHTPGPWRVGQLVQNDGSMAIMAEERVALADDFETPEGEANARLIAAAPALLSALEHIGSILDTDPTNLPAEMTLTEIRAIFTAKARAAVKAAKGD